MLTTPDKIKVIKKFQREDELGSGVRLQEKVVPSKKEYDRSKEKRVELPDERGAGMVPVVRDVLDKVKKMTGIEPRVTVRGDAVSLLVQGDRGFQHDVTYDVRSHREIHGRLRDWGLTPQDMEVLMEQYKGSMKAAGSYEDMQLLRGRVSSMLDSIADRLELSGYVKEALEIDKIADVYSYKEMTVEERADAISSEIDTLKDEMSDRLASKLDTLSDTLESLGLVKAAFELDSISNTLEKR